MCPLKCCQVADFVPGRFQGVFRVIVEVVRHVSMVAVARRVLCVVAVVLGGDLNGLRVD